MIRSGLLAYIALSLLLGQINLPLFTHVCHGMGKTWTSVAKPPKACCGKRKLTLQEPHKSLSNPKSCDTIDKSRCCEDHINYASLSVGLIHQLVKTYPHFNWIADKAPFVNRSFFQSALTSIEGIVYVHGPPGKLHGRSLLISQQIFRC